ncbi:hypothetical protein FWG76_00150 [Candidatus Saccharibacteria bacterium]|nr:hypothetical protein [Candidatus Saccharibacteria bacterium]
MNAETAIPSGVLAGNILFYGASINETISFAGLSGGWDNDRSYSTRPAAPWSYRGAPSNFADFAGVFAFGGIAGVANNQASHRTILLGY